MTDHDMLQMLRAVHELDVNETEERLAREQAQCLPLSRARALALDAAGGTEDERKHVATCRRCASLMRSFTHKGSGEPTVIRFPGSVSLPNRRAVAAATGTGRWVQTSSPDQRLEAEFLEDDDQLVLEVRTRDATLNQQLFRYAFRGADGPEAVTGFILLRPDANGWYAGHARFDTRALYAGLGAKVQELVIQSVDAA